MREAIDEPSGGEARHPGADDGDALAEVEEAEVAVTQRAADVGEGAEPRRGLLRWRRLARFCFYCGPGHRILSFGYFESRRLLFRQPLDDFSRFVKRFAIPVVELRDRLREPERPGLPFMPRLN